MLKYTLNFQTYESDKTAIFTKTEFVMTYNSLKRSIELICNKSYIAKMGEKQVQIVMY